MRRTHMDTFLRDIPPVQFYKIPVYVILVKRKEF